MEKTITGFPAFIYNYGLFLLIVPVVWTSYMLYIGNSNRSSEFTEKLSMVIGILVSFLILILFIWIAMLKQVPRPL
jgi:hypothetical protein